MKLSVTLLLLHGVPSYNVKGELISKNEKVTLIQGSSEWENFMKHLKANGISEVKVEKAFDLDKVNEKVPVSSDKRYEEVKDLESIQEEVNKIFKAPEIPLTPEQLQIKELQEKLAELTNANQTAKQNQVAPELKEAKERYEKIVGKKGGPSWTVEQINEKIAEFEAEQKK